MGVELKTIVGGLAFEGAVMNTSGVKDTTLEELKVIADSASCAVVTKTTKLRMGTRA